MRPTFIALIAVGLSLLRSEGGALYAQEVTPDDPPRRTEPEPPRTLGRVTSLLGVEPGAALISESTGRGFTGFLGVGHSTIKRPKKSLDTGTTALRVEFSGHGVGLLRTGYESVSVPIGDEDAALLLGGQIMYPQFTWSSDDRHWNYLEVPLRPMVGLWFAAGPCQLAARTGYGFSLGTLGTTVFKGSYGIEALLVCSALAFSAEAFRYSTDSPTDRYDSTLIFALSTNVMIGARAEMMLSRAEGVTLWSGPVGVDRGPYEVHFFLRLGTRFRD